MDKLLTYLLLLIGYISSKLSIKKRTSLGKKVGFILRKLSKSREEITYNNLMVSFPEKDKSWLKDIVNKCYQNLGIVLVEVLTLKYISEEDIRQYVKFDTFDKIHEVFNRGKGLIFLSAHYGNWEFVAYAAGLLSGIPILMVAKPQKNKYADEILNQYRTLAVNEVVSMFNAARKIIQRLKDGGAIAILADQSATGDKDIFIDFFGRPAATFESPAALALKFNVPIIYGFAVRNEDGTYSINPEELKYDDLENNEEGIRVLTERHVKLLEVAIREHPELWAWQHKRWKYNPTDK